MGSVKKYLFRANLPQRELHHSRLFVDLAENIHIHHREYRTVFSLDEYFEYADIIKDSTEDVRNYLEQNPSYRESQFPTTIMIACGKERQLKFLDNSPAPNISKYYSNDFAIELQDEYVTDEIHIHYRDFRIALDRKRFRIIANGFASAINELDTFENSNEYKRERHPDREINNFNVTNSFSDQPSIQGIQKIVANDIKSFWHKDIRNDWNPTSDVISALIENYHYEKRLAPIILSTESDGTHYIVDGHHRYYAALELGLERVDSVILDLAFHETESIRKAEVLLKGFDEKTNYKYGLSDFMKSFLSYRLNRYYAGSFNEKLRRQTWWWKSLRAVKRTIFGDKVVFKSFNEAHNFYKRK